MVAKRFAAMAWAAAGMFVTAGSAGAAVTSTYSGNGASGFGGTLGNGSLVIGADGAGNVTFTLNPSGGFSGNAVVVYIDSVAGGVNNTSTFTDNGDVGRESISAANSGNPSRVNISFPTGFGADYALEFENNTYMGLFNLSTPSNFGYVTGAAPTSGGPYTVTFPLSSLGLSTGQGFTFDADLISTSAYGSNETIGASVTTGDPSGSAPNAGFNGSIAFTTADTFTTAVPEPASVGLVAVAGLLAVRRRRIASA
jgi:hypothetical protein